MIAKCRRLLEAAFGKSISAERFVTFDLARVARFATETIGHSDRATTVASRVSCVCGRLVDQGQPGAIRTSARLGTVVNRRDGCSVPFQTVAHGRGFSVQPAVQPNPGAMNTPASAVSIQRVSRSPIMVPSPGAYRGGVHRLFALVPGLWREGRVRGPTGAALTVAKLLSVG